MTTQQTQTQLSPEEVARRGEMLYAERLRSVVETPENIGKMLIIDVETGDYTIDSVGIESSHRLQAKHPGANLYGIRVGYKTAEALGGILERRA